LVETSCRGIAEDLENRPPEDPAVTQTGKLVNIDVENQRKSTNITENQRKSMKIHENPTHL